MQNPNIHGRELNLYLNERTEQFSERVFINSYRKKTEEKFKDEKVYSLHLTKENAELYLEDLVWRPVKVAEEVFVSKPTLKKIIEMVHKCLFDGWES